MTFGWPTGRNVVDDLDASVEADQEASEDQEQDEAARERAERIARGTEKERIRQLLRKMGVAETEIANLVEDLLGNDEAIRALETQVVGPQQPTPYEQALVTYSDVAERTVVPSVSSYLGANPELAKTSAPLPAEGSFIGPQTGAIKYENGVIADPSTGQVFFPPTNQEAAGSAAWIRKVQDAWKEPQIKSWRTKLAKMGYLEDAQGKGFDVTLVNALSAFHETRYLNGGKALPNSPELTIRARAKDAFDPVERRQFATAMLEDLFAGDKPSDAEVERAAKHMGQYVQHALMKGASPESARMRAGERYKNQLEDSPAGELAMNTLELEDEANTSVSDSIINAFQILSSL